MQPSQGSRELKVAASGHGAQDDATHTPLIPGLSFPSAQHALCYPGRLGYQQRLSQGPRPSPL